MFANDLKRKENLKNIFSSAAIKHVFPERYATEKNNIQPLAIKKECPKSQFTILGFASEGNLSLFFSPCVVMNYSLACTV